MSYEILFAEGFGLDANVADIEERYGVTVDGNLYPYTLDGDPLTGLAFSSSQPEWIADLSIAPDLTTLYAQTKSLNLSWASMSLTGGPRASLVLVQRNLLDTAWVFRAGVEFISSAYRLHSWGENVLLSASALPVGYYELAVRPTAINGLIVTLQTTLYRDGVQIAQVAGSMNYQTELRLAMVHGSSLNSPIFRTVGNLVLARSPDDPTFLLGKPRVTPAKPVSFYTEGAFTSSEVGTSRSTILGRPATDPAYIFADTNTAERYNIDADLATYPSIAEGTVLGTSITLTAETEGSETATIYRPNGLSGTTIMGAKDTVTYVHQGPTFSPLGVVTSGFPTAPSQVVFENKVNSDVTTDWVVPSGVTSISLVIVSKGGVGYPATGSGGGSNAGRGGGGGALGYVNDVAVTPGETLTFYLSNTPGGLTGIKRGETFLYYCNNGNGVSPGTPGPGLTGYVGGNPGSTTGTTGLTVAAGSGGAAGYAGSGGAGGPIPTGGANVTSSPNPPAGSGAGSGGGGATVGARRGGGVGLLGIGSTGVGTTGDGVAGSGGSSYTYGGGVNNGLFSHSGIRIMWGSGRSYPNNAGDV